jgi:hypothetical protein
MATKGLLIVLVISVKDAQITETYLSAQSSILIENGYVSLVVIKIKEGWLIGFARHLKI